MLFSLTIKLSLNQKQREVESRICPNCDQTFEPNHGNRIYCSPDCYEDFKQKKQKENNDLMRQCRLGFLKNYRLFRELLPETGSFNIALFKLLKKSFDQDAFYGTSIDKKGRLWHKVNEYFFNIAKLNEQPTLYLFKP